MLYKSTPNHNDTPKYKVSRLFLRVIYYAHLPRLVISQASHAYSIHTKSVSSTTSKFHILVESWFYLINNLGKVDGS